MTQYNFDQLCNRLGSDSEKWGAYPADVLPLWVADMDFPAPPQVLQALHERVEHGVFGYGGVNAELAALICDRLWNRHAWRVTPDQILFIPGLVSALNLVSRAACPPGGGVLVQTPIYPPFLTAPGNQERRLVTAELAHTRAGNILHYHIDFDLLENAVKDKVKLFMLCNPHNPVGRCYTREELTHLAEICARHDLILCSDEIHCDLLLGDSLHIPAATLSPEIADRTITLMAPSKTFNIAGLYCGFAVIQNPALYKQVQQTARGIIPNLNLLSLVAGRAAYLHGADWHAQLLDYLTANRDFYLDFMQQHLPMLPTTAPEGTFLAWMDCREVKSIAANPYAFFLNQAKVAFNDGNHFGPGGRGFVRLNFGCPRVTLEQALQRMHAALTA